MNFDDIEAAAFRSWPALEESEDNGIVLRFSNGYTKRANSANVLTKQDGDFATLLGLYEAYFKNKALPCVFRIPSFSDNHKLDDYLDRYGYEAIDHTLVLQRSLAGASFDDSEILNSSCDDWYRIRKVENLTVNNAFSIEEGNPELADTLESELLKSLREHLPQALNTRFVLSAKNSQGDIIGGLTASTSYGWLLIKVLRVDEAHRHSGIGRSLMKSAEIKGGELGCHSAWLDTSSPDTMTFYLSLGYECFGELANTETQYPPQHHRWFMKKVL